MDEETDKVEGDALQILKVGDSLCKSGSAADQQLVEVFY